MFHEFLTVGIFSERIWEHYDVNWVRFANIFEEYVICE